PDQAPDSASSMKRAAKASAAARRGTSSRRSRSDLGQRKPLTIDMVGRKVRGMNVDVRHSPSFAAARVTLSGGEELKAESSAMMAISAGVEVKTSTQDGMMNVMKRSLLGG